MTTEEGMTALRAAGFEPRTLHPLSGHCRIKVKGHGWFDFWVKSWKWAESMRPGGVQGERGQGVETLIAAIRKIP